MKQTAVEQKAKELLWKYLPILEGWKYEDSNTAKKCALIAVDEILTALDEHQWQNRNVIEFYFSVKQEIEKL
jgi:hypothetical protein